MLLVIKLNRLLYISKMPIITELDETNSEYITNKPSSYYDSDCDSDNDALTNRITHTINYTGDTNLFNLNNITTSLNRINQLLDCKTQDTKTRYTNFIMALIGVLTMLPVIDLSAFIYNAEFTIPSKRSRLYKYIKSLQLPIDFLIEDTSQ